MQLHDIIKGIPAGLIAGTVAGILGKFASVIGFFATTYFGVDTALLFATVVFLAIWIEQALTD